MTSNNFSPKLYSVRNTHMTIGMLIWLITKIKMLLMVHMIDGVWDLNYSFEIAYMVYIVFIILLRIVLECYIRRKLQ